MADTDTPGGPQGGPSENGPADETAPPTGQQGSAEAAAGIEIPAEQLKEIIGVLQTEIDTLKTEKLRLIADMDNLRKRAEREKVETAKYAITKFAQDVVGVTDNFERAASAVPAEAAEKDAALKSFLGGVLLAEREFLAVLERHGVKRIEAERQPFNPHQHQAVMEREDTSVPAGTVLQVFQAGFMIEDRCLRPAMVVVSSGGPRAPKAAAGNEAPPADAGSDG
jgi:molecular chaperone GrpE